MVIHITILLLYASSFAGLAPQEGVIRGRVTDTSGCPIASAAVIVLDRQGKEIQRATTGTDGAYVLSRLPTGRAEVVLRLVGFEETRHAILVTPGETILDSALTLGRIAQVKPHLIHGIVTSSDRSEIADATVTLIGALDRRTIRQTRTDARGRYALETVDSGQFIVVVSHPRYAVDAKVVEFRYDDGESATIAFRLRHHEICER